MSAVAIENSGGAFFALGVLWAKARDASADAISRSASVVPRKPRPGPDHERPRQASARDNRSLTVAAPFAAGISSVV
jgi:hypothetical protein